ncbi:MAG TPA: hypothetical protein VLA10_05765, partial [Ilumatobacter sp.]|nr:hypothetical protein [Ilumatobacter sp.]
NHEPTITDREAKAKANDIAAGPVHPMTLPRCKPGSGSSGANASSTGRQRSPTGGNEASEEITPADYRTNVR